MSNLGTIWNGKPMVEAFAVREEDATHMRCDANLLGITNVILVEIPSEPVKDLDPLHLIRVHAEEGRPVLAFGDLCPALLGDMRFHAAVGGKNVRVLPLHADHERILMEYQSILRGEGVEDTLAGELIGLADPSTLGLAQRLAHARTDEAQNECIAEARTHGYTGSFDDIYAAIASNELSRPVDWSGKVLPGVYCDIVRTLWDDHKYFIPGVYEYLAEQSKSRPITLWTGGQLRSTEELLRMMPLPDGGTGIRWKLASKYWFIGATVEEAIDDTPMELAEERYQIQAQTIKIPEDLA